MSIVINFPGSIHKPASVGPTMATPQQISLTARQILARAHERARERGISLGDHVRVGAGPLGTVDHVVVDAQDQPIRFGVRMADGNRLYARPDEIAPVLMPR
jgi:hypothetical protein